MDQRFQQMGTMMGQAQNAHGAQLIELMQKHMQFMQEQMKAMRSLMGDGVTGGMAAGGVNGMMGGNGSNSGNVNVLTQMQMRMDMMQRMLDQQKLMVQSTPTKQVRLSIRVQNGW